MNLSKKVIGLGIVFVLFIFLAYSVYDASDICKTHVETFTVTDPTADQYCNLSSIPDTARITVEQNNSFVVSTVPSYGYNVTGQLVVVDDGVLYS